MILIATVKFALLLVYRSRILWGAVVGLVFMLGFSWVGFTFSGRQPQTVALDLGLSFIRFFVAVFGILLIQELVAKEAERRLVFTSLTYPCVRTVFLLGRFLAIYFLTVFILLTMFLALAVAVHLFGFEYGQKTPVNVTELLLLVSAFYAVDFFVILAFSTLLAVIVTVPGLVLLLSVGFMILARGWSAVMSLLLAEGADMGFSEQYRESVSWLRYLLPDLGGLDVRAIALYDKLALLPAQAESLLLAALAYALLLLAVACLRFELRQFN